MATIGGIKRMSDPQLMLFIRNTETHNARYVFANDGKQPPRAYLEMLETAKTIAKYRGLENYEYPKPESGSD